MKTSQTNFADKLLELPIILPKKYFQGQVGYTDEQMEEMIKEGIKRKIIREVFLFETDEPGLMIHNQLFRAIIGEEFFAKIEANIKEV